MKQKAEECAGFGFKDSHLFEGRPVALYLSGLERKATACLAPDSGENEIVVRDESVVGFVGPEKQHVLLEEEM